MLRTNTRGYGALLTLAIILCLGSTTALASVALTDTSGTVLSFRDIENTPVNMADDNNGGHWIVWATDGDVQSELHFQHIDARGNLLLTPGGEVLIPPMNNPSFHHQLNPGILADGNGGFFISYRDSVSGSSFATGVVQYFDAAGNGQWGLYGYAPAGNLTTKHSEIQMALADNGELAVLWKDEYGALPGLYAQLLDADGYRQWTDNGVWVDLSVHEVSKPRMAWLPTSKLAIAWEAAPGGETPVGIYWQAISNTGSNLLGFNGEAVFVDDSIEFTDPVITLSTGGNFIVAAMARELLGDHRRYVVAQKFGRESLNAHWSMPNGVVCGDYTGLATQNIDGLHLMSGPGGGAFVAYTVSAPIVNLGPGKLFFQKIDNDGNRESLPYGVDAWTLSSEMNIELIHMAKMDNDEIVYVTKQEEPALIKVVRARTNFTSHFVFPTLVWTEDSLSAYDFDVRFALAMDSADRTVLLWSGMGESLHTLRYLFWDEFGLRQHAPAGEFSTLDVAGDDGRQLELTWTASNYDSQGHHTITGYSVMRNDNQVWTHLQTVPAVGLTTYSAIVPTLADSGDGNPGTTEFRIITHTEDPGMFWIGSTFAGASVNNLGPVVGTVLNKAYPNPFNPSTTLSFSLEASGPAKLEIYDVAGKRVAVIADEVLTAGAHQYTWLGRNMRGRTVSSGVYFARLKTTDADQVQQLTLIK